MKKLSKRLLSLFVVSLCSSYSALAQSPYRSSVTGDIKVVKLLSRDLNDGAIRNSTPVRPKKAMRLSFSASGLGRVKAVLNKISYKSWESFIEGPFGEETDFKDVILVSGYIKAGLRKRPIAGSIYTTRGGRTLFLIMYSRTTSKRSAYIQIPLDTKKRILEARISSITSAAMQRATCGVNTSRLAGTPRRNALGITTGAATISTDADPEYYTAYGADTNAHIATLVNAASSIYQNQMGISLRIGTQHVYTSPIGNPYTSTDSGALLSQFQNNLRSTYLFGTSTAYHLFSGKDFDGSIVGLAFGGSICASQEHSIGTTQRYHPASDASIFAHELGHNFGAPHDVSDTRSIMGPSVSLPGSTYFSSASIGQIQTHLATHDSCLEDPLADPDDPADYVSGLYLALF